MFLCIKDAEIYAPEYQGKADVLICNEKVIQIAPQIEVSALPGQVKVLLEKVEETPKAEEPVSEPATAPQAVTAKKVTPKKTSRKQRKKKH